MIFHEVKISIASVGSGIRNAKNIGLAEKLAHRSKVSAAVSHLIVDDEWCGYNHQLVQTGKTVGPLAYIAFGVPVRCGILLDLRERRELF